MLVTLYEAVCTFAFLARLAFMRGQRMKDLLLRACVVVRISNMKISRRHLADYVNKLNQKAGGT